VFWDDTRVLNRLDIFLIAVLALAAWTGWNRGALRRVLSWGGLVGGFLAGALLAPTVASAASDPVGQVSRALAVLAAGAVLGGLLGSVAGRMIRGVTRDSAAGKVDSTAGALLSVLVIAFVAWFLALNLSNGPNARLAEEIRGSTVVRALDTVIPEPPDLLAQVRNQFGRFDFPQVFAGLPPVPTGPVTGPDEVESSAASEAAAGSTVRVLGQACGRLLEGSGFTVADGVIATNAHVVAGADRVEVQQQDGLSQSGQVIVFDPATDVAMVRVPESPGDPLPLVSGEVERGTGGAVVGHPEGGALAGVDAAVTRVINAKGRDIYGRKRVLRRVYELQAMVLPGSSGSPFALPNGQVAGMVFASSTTDPGLGYAITSGQMSRHVERALARTAPVGTGECT